MNLILTFRLVDNNFAVVVCINGKSIFGRDVGNDNSPFKSNTSPISLNAGRIRIIGSPGVRRCAKVGHGRRLIPYHPYEGEIWQKDENAKIVVPRGNRNNPCIQKQLFTKVKG